MPQKDPEARRVYLRDYYLRNAGTMKATAKRHYQEKQTTPEARARRQQATLRWRRENREKYLAARRANHKRRMQDPEFREKKNRANAAYRAQKIPAIKALVALRKSSGCSRCPERETDCLDFHHVRPEEKSFQITPYQIAHKSLEAIEAEIAKCVVLCANCHRKVHAGLLSID